MLHIGLLVLKVIGFLLLGVLGIVIFLLLLVLLVPIRYRIKGFFDERRIGTVKLTWLLHIFSLKATYEKELDVSVLIFGIRMRKLGAKTHAAPDTDGEESVWPESENLEMDIPDMDMPEVELQEMSIQEVRGPVEDEPAKQTMQGQTNASTAQEETSDMDDRTKRNVHKEKDKTAGLHKLKFSFQAFCDKLRTIKDNTEKIKEALTDVANKKTLHLIIVQVKKLLAHIFPQKSRGAVTFGFDDPYTTGQVLSILSIFYSRYYKHVTLSPVFDRAVLEGWGDLKGRMRAGTILFLALRVYMDKNFRRLLKQWLN